MWDWTTCAQNISTKFPTILSSAKTLKKAAKKKLDSSRNTGAARWISQNIAVKSSKFPLQTWTSFTSLLINFGGFGRAHGFNARLDFHLNIELKDRYVDFWRRYEVLKYWSICAEDDTHWFIKKNIARGTTDPGYWVYNLNHVFD